MKPAILDQFAEVIKVYFEGNDEETAKKRNLTFFAPFQDPLEISNFSAFLLTYNDLARKGGVKYFSNIREVIPLKHSNKFMGFVNYYALLFTKKDKADQPDKRGLLIGQKQDHNFFLVGVWPFQETYSTDSIAPSLEKIFAAILNNSPIISEVILIT